MKARCFSVIAVALISISPAFASECPDSLDNESGYIFIRHVSVIEDRPVFPIIIANARACMLTRPFGLRPREVVVSGSSLQSLIKYVVAHFALGRSTPKRSFGTFNVSWQTPQEEDEYYVPAESACGYLKGLAASATSESELVTVVGDTMAQLRCAHDVPGKP